MSDIVLVFADEDISSIFMKENKRKDFLHMLKKKLFPPLGILYIAKLIEEEKISVKILDLLALNYSIEDTIKRIELETPKIVGFSVQSTNLHKTHSIIKGLRKKLDAKIVLGGPHIKYSPAAVIYLDGDFAIAGDGEYSFRELTKAILNNSCIEEMDNIPGLVRKNGRDIVCNGDALINNLDSLPFPARHLWPHRCFSPLLSDRIATLLTSRGCLYDCIFCGLPGKRTIRLRSVQNVVDEFEHLYKLGYRYIELQDDFFTYDCGRVSGVCKELLKRKIKVKWTCVTRADYVDYDLLRLMKKSGCSHVKYGIECSSERLRNSVIGKKINKERIIKGIQSTRRAGIYSIGYFVIGIPTETIQDIKETIRFAYDLNLDYLDFHLTLIISGSRLLERAIEEGKVKRNIWEEVAKGVPVPIYVSNNLNIAEMQRLILQGLTKFYFSPQFLFKESILRTKDFNNLYNKAKLIYSMAKGLILES